MVVEQQATALPSKLSSLMELPVLGQFAGYDILGRLALGGMAEILLARHKEKDGEQRILAVKRILQHFQDDKDFVKMFLDEAYIGMQLEHPNICKFYQCGADEGSHFIIMEWINGMPLGRLIRKSRKHGGMGVPLVLRIGAAVASALHYAHMATDEHGERLNLIHRDVSPHNVMISFDGDVKLLDFGIAKADQRAYKTQAGVVKGKFAYMAPEQCTGAKADHRLDVFALGVCIFEMLTGRSLYRRETEAATMRSVIMDPVPSLRDRIADFPEELDLIIQKALAKDAEDRYATAGDFAQAMDDYAKKTNQVVPQREIRQFVRQVCAEEFQRGPHVDTVPFGSSYNADNISSESGVVSQAVSAKGKGLRELEESTDEESNLAHLLDMPGDVGPSNAAAPGGAAQQMGSFVPPKREVSTRKTPYRRGPEPKPSSGGWFGKMIILLALAGAAAYLTMENLSEPATAVDTNVDPLPPPPQDQNDLLHGRIIVGSSPPGSRVFLDGEDRGVTPATFSKLVPGEYQVSVEAPGFASWSTTVKVTAGNTDGVTAQLLGKQGGAPPGSAGRIRIETNPPAEVFLAGDSIGRTPIDEVYAPLGRVTLDFELDDGRTRKRHVVVKSDRMVRARYNFNKDR